MSAPTICAICRQPVPASQDRSVCFACLPPDESEIVARAKLLASRNEVRDLQSACDEHIRIRNEQGERILNLERALRYAAECSTLEMVRDTARGMGVIE
jgi:hypothetical protein